ncbi:hypothetical protein OIU92_00105 [Escherichia coli]|nr:hypothetical protein [Escherichia coli]
MGHITQEERRARGRQSCLNMAINRETNELDEDKSVRPLVEVKLIRFVLPPSAAAGRTNRARCNAWRYQGVLLAVPSVTIKSRS